MTTKLSETLASLDIQPRSLAVFWLGQAGFAIKTSSGQLLFLDAYVTNMCEYLPGGGIGSKRLIPSPLDVSDLTRNVMVFTHRHQDHMDDEAIRQVSQKSPEMHFAGPVSCYQALQNELNVSADRAHLLRLGETLNFHGFSLRAVYADHGESEADAVGIVLETDGIRVYHTGDTSYCPERMSEVIALKPDIILPCINGTYGNLDGIEAAQLANDVGAKVAIPSHYWFFIAQNLRAEGTPHAFLKACETYAPHTIPLIPTIGEAYVYKKE